MLVVGFLLTVPAKADRVLTRDGRVRSGPVTIDAAGNARVGSENVPRSDLARITLDDPDAQPGLSGVTYKVYLGDWKTLPDLKATPIDELGQASTNTLKVENHRRVFNLKAGQVIGRWDAPRVKDRPFSAQATVEAVAGDGVILAQGGNIDGYSLYLLGGHLHFATRVNNALTAARDTMPFPLHRRVKITAELRRDLNLVLTVDGREAAKSPSPGLLQRHPFEGLSVGHDQRPALVASYPAENHFQGEIHSAQVRLIGEARIYSGELNVPAPGRYQFQFNTHAATRLEVNGRAIIDTTRAGQHRNGFIDLPRGSHDFKLTRAHFATTQPAPANAPEFSNLKWIIPGKPLTAVPHAPNLAWQPPNMAIPTLGIMMRDGSFIARNPVSVDSTRVRYEGGSVQRFYTSAVFFRHITVDEARNIPNRSTGVLWDDGTFTKGRLHSLDIHSVNISSVLFGLKKLKRGEEAAAVIINKPDKPSPRLAIRLRDGSIHFAKKIYGDGGRLALTHPPYRVRSFPRGQVAEIYYQRQSSLTHAAEERWKSLSDLGRHLLEIKGKGVQAVFQN